MGMADYLPLVELVLTVVLTVLGIIGLQGFRYKKGRKRVAFLALLLFALALLLGLGYLRWSIITTERTLTARQGKIAIRIEGTLDRGRDIRDEIANNAEAHQPPSCRGRGIYGPIEAKVEEWKGCAARLLSEELPNSGADRQFGDIVSIRSQTPCPETYADERKISELVQRLSAILGRLREFCLKVGPTCEKG